jgi:hypothetical protein
VISRSAASSLGKCPHVLIVLRICSLLRRPHERFRCPSSLEPTDPDRRRKTLPGARYSGDEHASRIGRARSKNAHRNAPPRPREAEPTGRRARRCERHGADRRAELDPHRTTRGRIEPPRGDLRRRCSQHRPHLLAAADQPAEPARPTHRHIDPQPHPRPNPPDRHDQT